MEADKKTTTEEAGFFKKYGFYLALAVLAVIVMLPNPEGLSVAGQRMIGIMVFSVIVWATTAISYPVSAGVIMMLMALLKRKKQASSKSMAFIWRLLFWQ